MSFTAIIITVVLTGLIATGLYLSRLAAIRQAQQQEIKKRLRQHRLRQDNIEELFGSLMVFDRNLELLNTVQNLLVQEARQTLQIAPNDPKCEHNLQYFIGLSEKIVQLGELVDSPQTPSSDREISILKRHFARTIKLLRSLVPKGIIGELAAHEHIKRLYKNALLLEVDAYKHQGERAKANQNLSSAASYFKHAKELLIHTDIEFDHKSQQIRDISKMIANLYTSDLAEPTQNEPEPNQNRQPEHKLQ